MSKNTMKTSITVDVISNGDGTYDTYITTECSSGSQYRAIDAKTIGDYVANLIDCLEESHSGTSYLSKN